MSTSSVFYPKKKSKIILDWRSKSIPWSSTITCILWILWYSSEKSFKNDILCTWPYCHNIHFHLLSIPIQLSHPRQRIEAVKKHCRTNPKKLLRHHTGMSLLAAGGFHANIEERFLKNEQGSKHKINPKLCRCSGVIPTRRSLCSMPRKPSEVLSSIMSAISTKINMQENSSKFGLVPFS